MTLLMSIVSLIAIPRLLRFYPKVSSARRVLVALLGIWMAGPVYMHVSAVLSGRGFATPDFTWIEELALSLLLFPIITFSFATYDGSLYALLITTVGLIAFGGEAARKRE